MADFYSDPEYRRKQSERTRKNWSDGVFDFIRKKEGRKCKRIGCENKFVVIPSDPKIYCSSRCSALVNNSKRAGPSYETKVKISLSLKGRVGVSRRKGIIIVPRQEIICGNLDCHKIFYRERWMKRKFCSVACAMKVTGSKPTSPKASRGKAGIRKDIDNKTYFFSRWEANMARIYNYLGIKWIHQPQSFDIGNQSYTPDFYLPDQGEYIEVKNFLGDYSRNRDDKFRELYPKVTLTMILKEEYLKLEAKYSKLIQNWEYNNSKFESQ